ncbi:right-handed parallel beta-helix repeat-containing protein [Hoeflea sp.]|uniref:right-handed parallel beta-helix repeat-containing protein n=1 Tax=Hoeflea sp. TaxID=1940281 RepID=UPI003A8DA919
MLGHYGGAIDGVWGLATRTALSEFALLAIGQRAELLNAELYEHLENAESYVLASNLRSTNVEFGTEIPNGSSILVKSTSSAGSVTIKSSVKLVGPKIVGGGRLRFDAGNLRIVSNAIVIEGVEISSASYILKDERSEWELLKFEGRELIFRNSAVRGSNSGGLEIGPTARSASVVDSVIENNNRTGITIIAEKGFVGEVQDTSVLNNGYVGIALSNGQSGYGRVVIRGNKISGNGRLDERQPGIWFNGCVNADIRNNDLRGNKDPFHYAFAAEGCFTLRNNRGQPDYP